MAIFTRQHYQAIAETLANCDNAGFDHIEVAAVAKEFCKTFSRDNPNFNRARFLKACGVKDST